MTLRIWPASPSGRSKATRRRREAFLRHRPIGRAPAGRAAAASRVARGDAAQPSGGLRSQHLCLGQRQCGDRQNPRLDQSRPAPVAGGDRARAHPGPDLYQGRGSGDVQARVPATGRVDDRGRSRSQQQADRAHRSQPLAGRAAPCATAAGARNRDTRRPQGADHSCLLRAPAQTFPARGRSIAELHDPRRSAAPALDQPGGGRHARRRHRRQIRRLVGGSGDGHCLRRRRQLRASPRRSAPAVRQPKGRARLRPPGCARADSCARCWAWRRMPARSG